MAADFMAATGIVAGVTIGFGAAAIVGWEDAADGWLLPQPLKIRQEPEIRRESAARELDRCMSMYIANRRSC